MGVLATNGTVQSESYVIEINKFFPEVNVFQEACPMWVPLVENNEYNGPGADFFVKKHIDNILAKSAQIDTILLACTHYPLLEEKIRMHLPGNVRLLSQGEIVASSLADYLHRHPEIESRCSKQGTRTFFTTDSVADFNNHASIFFGENLESHHVVLN